MADSIFKKILGYFWYNQWQDSLLISGLQAVFLSMSDKISQVVHLNITDTLDYKNDLVSTKPCLRSVLIQADLIKNKIQLLSIIIGDSTTSLIDLLVEDGRKYLIIKGLPVGSLFSTVYSKETALSELSYTTEDGYLISTVALKTLKLSTILYDTGSLIIECYKLWYDPAESIAVNKNFAAILHLPTDWALTKPKVIQTAWLIKYKGCSKPLVKNLLLLITGCYRAKSAGRVTYTTDGLMVANLHYTNKTGHYAVSDGAYVEKDALLFSASSDTSDGVYVYTYGDSIPKSIINKLPINTEFGVLYAPNDSLAAANNILPLEGSNIWLYTEACGIYNLDKYRPFVQIPTTVNPMLYLRNTVWKHMCIVIRVPDTNTDIQTLLQFLLENIPVGCLLFIYKYTNVLVPIKLNLNLQASIISYRQNPEE